MEPDPDLLRSAVGSEPLSLEPVAGGYTRSCAWRVTTRDGTAFVKQADDEGSLHMLRQEAIVYGHVRGSFLPGFVGFADGVNERRSRSSTSPMPTGLPPIPMT